MSAIAQPQLKPGRAYRTRDLRPWSANPTRLARRLMAEGKLQEAAHGLYYVPIPTKFGPAPPAQEELLRAYLGSEAFLITGPPQWNALGLGSTTMFAVTLVYNTRRTGEVVLGGQRFLLRRVCFPEAPTPEWFVVDLLQHHEMAGAALSELREGLTATLRLGRWDRERLREVARTFGTKATLALVEGALREMLAERGITALPSADDPSLRLEDAAKRASVERAYARIAPMFWSARLPLGEACATIREWVSTLRG